MVDFTSLIDKLTPDGGKKNKSLQKKIFNLFFPKFSWKTFTFYWGLIWAGLNLFIIISENFVDRNVSPDGKNITKQCRLIMFGASVTPLIKYNYHYWRLLIGPFMCDNVMQVLIGLYIYWSYGFLYEKYYSKTVIMVVTFGGTLLGTFVGSFWEFSDVRAQGTVHVISWCCLYIFMIWEKLNYNIIWTIIKLSILILKGMACLMGSLTAYGDPIGTIAGALFTMILGLSVLKEVNPKFDEERKFIIMRLKIFLFIISMIIFLFALSYVTVMYDNRTSYNRIKTYFACDKKETASKTPQP